MSIQQKVPGVPDSAENESNVTSSMPGNGGGENNLTSSMPGNGAE